MNAVDLLFGGMEKLGPGGNEHTVCVLHSLTKKEFCFDQPFLDDLARRAREAKVEHLVRTYCMDMKEIPEAFAEIDLLWSEGAAYNIGFANAVSTWARALVSDGLAVVSELSWLSEEAPKEVENFFKSGYPDMRTVQDNLTLARHAGYRVLDTCYYTFSHPGPGRFSSTRTLPCALLPPRPCGRSRSSSAPRTATATCFTCCSANNRTLAPLRASNLN